MLVYIKSGLKFVSNIIGDNLKRCYTKVKRKRLEVVMVAAFILLIKISSKVFLTIMVFIDNKQQVSKPERTQYSSNHRTLIVTNYSTGSTRQMFYSAVASNSTKDMTWDRVTVQGWGIGYTKLNQFICRVKHRSGTIMKYRNVRSQPWVGFENVTTVAWQYRCTLNRDNSEDPPIDVAILSSRTDCNKTDINFLKVEFAFENPKKIAIFAKVLYGDLDPNDLLAWFEIHKALGVDIVVAHLTDILNENATKVLDYYRREGLLQLYDYPLPGRVEVMSNDTPECWNFKGVSAFDGAERLIGYEYVISMDLDEYLIPAKEENLSTVFNRLVESHPDAAGFLFHTYLHIKSWESYTDSIFSVARFRERSEPTYDRVKHVTLPRRVRPGGIRPHSFLSEDGYKAYNASVVDIAIHHYRECRDTWTTEDTNIKCSSLQKNRDDLVYRLFMLVKPKVLGIRKLLNI